MSNMVCVIMLALMAGIGLAHNLAPELLAHGAWPAWQWRMVAVMAVCVIAMMATHLIPRSRHKAAGLIMSGLVVAFWTAGGFVRYAIYADLHTLSAQTDDVSIRGIVTAGPVKHSRHSTIQVKQADSHIVLNLNIWDYDDSTHTLPTPSIGDYISGTAHLQRHPLNYGNPDEFDYQAWLWNQGVSATCDINTRRYTFHRATSSELASITLSDRLRLKALQLRQRLSARYRTSGLNVQSLAIVSAMTLADRSQIAAETRELYNAAGASHLLAMSGLHLGIIIGLMLIAIYNSLTHPVLRVVTVSLTLCLIWGFAFVAGLPTSLVRASVMYSIMLIAMMVGHNSRPSDYLILTVTVMLLASPTYLFDVGAQLSVGAVAGIQLLYKPMRSYAYAKLEDWHIDTTRKWYLRPIDALIVAIAAQTLTLPIVAVTFNRIAVYGALVSVVLVPLTTVTIYLALALLAAGGTGLAGGVLAWCINGLVATQVAVMQFVVKLPGAVVDDFWSRRAEPQIVVYNNRRCPAFHLIASPEKSWLLMPYPQMAATGMASTANSFWVRRLTAKPIIVGQRTSLATQDIKVVMLSSPTLHLEAAMPPGDITFLWLCGNFEGSMADILRVVHPRLVIIDASLPKRVRDHIGRECSRLRQPAYDIHERGAFRTRLPLAD